MSDLLRLVEAAAVRGWPALNSQPLDGWVLRHTSGGSVRANSAATLQFTGTNVEAAIDAAEAFYLARRAPVVFTISDVTTPPDLDQRLEARDYARGEAHVTMAKAVDKRVAAPSADIATGSSPPPGWMEAYLSGLSPDRRPVAPQLIANLPRNVCVFVAHLTDGRASSSGLTVLDGPVASVQCMATLPLARRRGGGQSVLKAIEAVAARRGCGWLYLQTSADNAPARALYESAGFDVIGHYHTRTRVA